MQWISWHICFRRITGFLTVNVRKKAKRRCLILQNEQYPNFFMLKVREKCFYLYKVCQDGSHCSYDYDITDYSSFLSVIRLVLKPKEK